MLQGSKESTSEWVPLASSIKGPPPRYALSKWNQPLRNARGEWLPVDYGPPPQPQPPVAPESQTHRGSHLRTTAEYQQPPISDLNSEQPDYLAYSPRPWLAPYSCPISSCGREFQRLEHLERHVRTHAQERPYVCVDCGKAFSRSDNLHQHRRLHEEGVDKVDPASSNADPAVMGEQPEEDETRRQWDGTLLGEDYPEPPEPPASWFRGEDVYWILNPTPLYGGLPETTTDHTRGYTEEREMS